MFHTPEHLRLPPDQHHVEHLLDALIAREAIFDACVSHFIALGWEDEPEVEPRQRQHVALDVGHTLASRHAEDAWHRYARQSLILRITQDWPVPALLQAAADAGAEADHGPHPAHDPARQDAACGSPNAAPSTANPFEAAR